MSEMDRRDRFAPISAVRSNGSAAPKGTSGSEASAARMGGKRSFAQAAQNDNHGLITRHDGAHRVFMPQPDVGVRHPARQREDGAEAKKHLQSTVQAKDFLRRQRAQPRQASSTGSAIGQID